MWLFKQRSDVRGFEINSPRDDIILILIVGYLCYNTITDGSSQHCAVVLFDLYVAASERSHVDAVSIKLGNVVVFNCRLQ